MSDKLISLTAEGAHILSPEIANKLAKKNISPSLVTGLEGCHARWLADQYVVKEVVEEEPDNAAIRGSLYHKIMEDFFALPQDERTTNQIKKITKASLISDDFKVLQEYPEAIKWIREAINGYYSMGGKPQEVTIADIVLEGKDAKPGIELFVKDQIGDSSRPTLGFVDQIVVDNVRNDGSVVINDWKSGAKAKHYKANGKNEDGLPEQRQQILYTEILRANDVRVSGARLIYPIAREVIKVDLANEELRTRAINDVEKADKKLDKLLETNTFGLKPGFLCSWCPLSHGCPSAEIKPYDKMMKAFAAQPTIEQLESVVEFS
jgi:hypothetical protein